MDMVDMKVRYPHLCLVDWPFQAASRDFSCFMADRKELEMDIVKTLQHLSRRSTSTIHLMWAWYGAGKSHSLIYMANHCNNDFKGMLPVFTEFPEKVSGFRDLYRIFTSQLDYEMLTECFLEISTSPLKSAAQKELSIASPDLANAMEILCIGTERQQNTIIRWLRGEDVLLRELREVGIGQRIVSADDALKILVWLIRLMGMAYSPYDLEGLGRIIWIIDEFQLIGDCREPVQKEINRCLVRIWKSCPNSFSLFLSFTGKPEKTFPSWLSKDLADIIGIEKVILLPPLQDHEAESFVRDLLEHFRPPVNVVDAYFPFEDDCVKSLLARIKKERKEIKPRSIMQYFSAVLEEADLPMQEKSMTSINIDFAMNCLKNRILAET